MFAPRIVLGAIACLLASGCARDYLVGDTDPSGDGSDSGSASSSSVEDDAGETTGSKDTGDDEDATDTGATDTKNADDKGTDDLGDDTVTAVYLPGGLDRIRIEHRAPTDGYCTVTTIVTPGADGDGTLKLPTDWGLEDAVLTSDTVDCDAKAADAIATVVSGEVTAIDDAPDGIPCKLEIDLQLKFGDDASIGTDDVVASNVPVMGCP